MSPRRGPGHLAGVLVPSDVGAASLGRLVDECARVGAPVAWLEAVPDGRPPTSTTATIDPGAP